MIVILKFLIEFISLMQSSHFAKVDNVKLHSYTSVAEDCGQLESQKVGEIFPFLTPPPQIKNVTSFLQKAISRRNNKHNVGNGSRGTTYSASHEMNGSARAGAEA